MNHEANRRISFNRRATNRISTKTLNGICDIRGREKALEGLQFESCIDIFLQYC
jgi:hypothetical protein